MNLDTRTMNNCGITELIGVNDPAGNSYGWTPTEFMESFSNILVAKNRANVNTFTKRWGQAVFVVSFAYDASNKGSKKKYRSPLGASDLNRLSRFIRDNELGTMHVMEDSPHPGYGGNHMIRAAMWTPNHKNLYNYLNSKKLLKKRTSWEEEYG